MSINYNAIMAWAAIGAVLVALIAFLSESKRWRFSLSVDLILRLDSYFNSSEFKKIRKKAATVILSKTSKKEEMVSVEDVLNFFEMVAFLTRRRALDSEMVWYIFSYWMLRWYYCAKDYIDMTRKNDPTIWADLVKMNEKRFIKIEKRKCRLVLVPFELELENFLKDESNL